MALLDPSQGCSGAALGGPTVGLAGNSAVGMFGATAATHGTTGFEAGSLPGVVGHGMLLLPLVETSPHERLNFCVSLLVGKTLKAFK